MELQSLHNLLQIFDEIRKCLEIVSTVAVSRGQRA
jgi:hypothetical protein